MEAYYMACVWPTCVRPLPVLYADYQIVALPQLGCMKRTIYTNRSNEKRETIELKQLPRKPYDGTVLSNSWF